MDDYLPLQSTLDSLLGGGIEKGIVTEFYGGGGTGKTNICIQAVKSCVKKGHKAIYLDSEGISKERLLQVLKDKKLLENILFFFPYSLKEQEQMIAKITKITTGIVIIDSANLFYRLEVNKNDTTAIRSLTKQMVTLQLLARKMNIPIIVTAQVYSIDNEVKPFAHKSIEHVAKTIVKLEKLQDIGKTEQRKATLIKHRCFPSNRSVVFKITSDGID